MLLFTFVFFIPLFIIIFSYCCIFRAIKHTTRLVHAHTPFKFNHVPVVFTLATHTPTCIDKDVGVSDGAVYVILMYC